MRNPRTPPQYVHSDKPRGPKKTSEQLAADVAQFVAAGGTIEQLPGFGEPGRVREPPKRRNIVITGGRNYVKKGGDYHPWGGIKE